MCLMKMPDHRITPISLDPPSSREIILNDFFVNLLSRHYHLFKFEYFNSKIELNKILHIHLPLMPWFLSDC